MKYITNFLFEREPSLFTDETLRQLIEMHNYQLFKQCLPLVKKFNSEILLLAIQEDQMDMVHDLLVSQCPVTTKCVTAMCQNKNYQQILTWNNLYGNDKQVDYHQVLENINDLECIKLFSNQLIPEYIINKAVYTNNLELFTTFFDNDITHTMLDKCIEYDRLDMIRHVITHYSNDVEILLNHLFITSVNKNKLDILTFILTYKFEIQSSTWNQLTNIEILCHENIIKSVFNNYPDKNTLLLNAICKNDTSIVEYIVKNTSIKLVNFSDVIIRQALINNNRDIIKLVFSLEREYSDGFDDISNLISNQELRDFVSSLVKNK